MQEGRFIAVPGPSRAEGLGRALNLAYRGVFELPSEMRAYVDRLDRVAI